MIRPSPQLTAVYICIEPVDFRKQASGLAAVVQDELALNPFSEQLFVFTNRRRSHCRILYWERNGFVLWTKRLERERFHWPRGDTTVMTLFDFPSIESTRWERARDTAWFSPRHRYVLPTNRRLMTGAGVSADFGIVGAAVHRSRDLRLA